MQTLQHFCVIMLIHWEKMLTLQCLWPAFRRNFTFRICFHFGGSLFVFWFSLWWARFGSICLRSATCWQNSASDALALTKKHITNNRNNIRCIKKNIACNQICARIILNHIKTTPPCCPFVGTPCWPFDRKLPNCQKQTQEIQTVRKNNCKPSKPGSP